MLYIIIQPFWYHKSRTHYPCDNCRGHQSETLIIHSEDGNPSEPDVKQALDAPVTRTASAAAKPCQGDSFEFYLITGSFPDGSSF
ncbi:hypothetical protein Tco_0352451 [Tanacetum coccineum]